MGFGGRHLSLPNFHKGMSYKGLSLVTMVILISRIKMTQATSCEEDSDPQHMFFCLAGTPPAKEHCPSFPMASNLPLLSSAETQATSGAIWRPWTMLGEGQDQVTTSCFFLQTLDERPALTEANHGFLVGLDCRWGRETSRSL